MALLSDCHGVARYCSSVSMLVAMAFATWLLCCCYSVARWLLWCLLSRCIWRC